jgi:hypothetical protein
VKRPSCHLRECIRKRSQEPQGLHRILANRKASSSSAAKIWGAACNADWIGKQLDGLMEEYKRCSELVALKAEIDASKEAPDHHTKDNPDTRRS